MAKTFLLLLLRHQRGATFTEYALLAGLVAVAAIVAMANLGDSVSTQYSEVESKVDEAT